MTREENSIKVTSEPSVKFREIDDFLFGKTTFPFWNNDLSQLLLGLETEFFIIAQDGSERLFTQSNFHKFTELLKKHGFTHQYAKENRDRISKDADRGYIVIEPDYGYHVLELALPPCRTPSEIESLLSTTLQQIDSCLGPLGFCRADFSVLDRMPDQWDQVHSERLKGFTTRLRDSVPREKRTVFTEPEFAACLSATHVHLNTSHASEVPVLPLLYETEWLAHLALSRGEPWRGMSCHNARALVYLATFPQSYKLCHVPRVIPSTTDELFNLYLETSPPLFTGTPPHGVKDMSVVRMRPFGSIEFRSADSFFEVPALIDVCTFRVLQTLYGRKYRNLYISATQDWQFDAVNAISCKTKPTPRIADLMKRAFERFEDCINELDSVWRSSGDHLFKSLRKKINELSL